MANAWIQHVKEYAKKNGMKYPVAVGDPGCKAAYNKRTQKKKRGGEGDELVTVNGTDGDSQSGGQLQSQLSIASTAAPYTGGKRRSRKAKGSRRSKKSRKNRK